MNRMMLVILMALYLGFVGYCLSELGRLDSVIKTMIFQHYGVEEK